MFKALGTIFALTILLGSTALAQSVDTHTVTINVPTLLRLTVDATDVSFDFADAVGGLGDSVDGLRRANDANYQDFLNGGAPLELFGPTAITGTTNDYVQAEILSNRRNWSLSASASSDFSLPLNDHLFLKVEKDAGGAGKGTTTLSGAYSAFNFLAPNLLAQSDVLEAGQGKSFYNVYYGFEARETDDIGATISEFITITYTLTSP